MNNPHLSVIIPIYNERKNLSELISRLIYVIKKDIKKTYEIILIDDGSDDNSWEAIKIFHHNNKNIKGICFVRNFGHQYALTAGLKAARGKIIFMLDGDLQHPPELLKNFKEKLDKGYEIVAGVRNNKEKLSVFKKTFSKFYYWFFNHLSKTRIVPGTSDFRLITREVADFVLSLTENDKFYRALFPWCGFKTYYFAYQVHKRLKGKAKFTFWKSLYMGMEGIISFSTKPLTLSIYLGFLIALLALFFGIYAAYERFILQHSQSGIIYLSAAIIFISGVQLTTMGIIGIYIGRITRQLMRRPEYIIKTHCGL